jgi:hypothetical protein
MPESHTWFYIPSQGIYFGPNQKEMCYKSAVLLLTLAYAGIWYFGPAKGGLSQARILTLQTFAILPRKKMRTWDGKNIYPILHKMVRSEK